jgi:SAM-dependent methyltransferase
MMSKRRAVLDPNDAGLVVRRYQERIGRHGLTSESLNSGDSSKQLIRHQVHSDALMGTCPTILDIGCGLGDFYRYLTERGYSCHYTGYDIVPEYITECSRLYPETNFQLRNFLTEGIVGVHDSIVMSQVLNNRYRHSDNMDVMRTAISLTFEHTRISVSIDMMSSYVDFQDPALFYYVPETIFTFARTVTHRVTLRHDYRPFEFCVQLFHEDAPGYVP